LPREDARDAFVSVKYAGIADLPEGDCWHVKPAPSCTAAGETT
jgi:hypothetical protein